MQGPNEKSVLNGHGPSSLFVWTLDRFAEVHFYDRLKNESKQSFQDNGH